MCNSSTESPLVARVMASEAQSDSEEKQASDRYEVTDRRAAARQRQLMIGKARPEYLRYVQCVPKDGRTPSCPQTPDPHAEVSKRQFDRQLSEWRRLLHEYDDPSIPPEQEAWHAEGASLQPGLAFRIGSSAGCHVSRVVPPPGLDVQAGETSVLNDMALGAHHQWGFPKAAKMPDSPDESHSISSTYMPEPMKICVPVDGYAFPYTDSAVDSGPKTLTHDELGSQEGCPVS